jgi:hypothetical protein
VDASTGPNGKEVVNGSSPLEGSEVAADQLFLVASETTVASLGVHRTSTARRDRFLRGVESLLLTGFAGLRCDVHPASTALSTARASRRETACSRLSRARWPWWRSIIAMLEPMKPRDREH